MSDYSRVDFDEGNDEPITLEEIYEALESVR